MCSMTIGETAITEGDGSILRMFRISLDRFRLPSEQIRRLLVEGIWVVLGYLAGVVGILASTRILTDLLNPATFGTLNLLLGISAFGTNVLCLPILQAGMRLYADAVEHGRLPMLLQVIRQFLLNSTLILVVLILGAGIIATTYDGGSLWPWVILIALTTFDVLRYMHLSFLTAARNHRKSGLWMAIDIWARPALAVLAILWLGTTYQNVLLGYLVATAAVYCVFRCLLGGGSKNLKPPDRGAFRSMAHEVWNYTLPFLPIGLIGSLSAFSDRYFIAGIIGLKEVGIYVAAYGLVSRPFQLVHAVLENIMRPAYYEAIAASKHCLASQFHITWLRFVTIMASGLAAGIFLWREWLAHIFVGSQYAGAAQLMPWLALGYAFSIVSHVYYTRLLALHHHRLVFFVRLHAILVSLAATPLGLWSCGLRGVAVSCPVAFGSELALVCLLSRFLYLPSHDNTRVADAQDSNTLFETASSDSTVASKVSA
jgi:O-antigen/teichoic acid export membrane protein